MVTLTYSSAGIEVRIEPPTFEVDLARGAQQGEREEVCRRFADRIGAEFSSAISQLLLSGAASEDFAGFEGAALQASHSCLRAVLQAGMESLDDGAARLQREGKLYRRVDPTPRRIMTSVGEVSYWRPRYRSDGEASIVPVDEQVCFAEGYFTELAAEQGVFLVSNLPPRDCVSLYEKLRIGGASLSSLQRLAETAGVHWEGCKEQALAEIRAVETVPEAATTVCISLDGTMLPMLAEEEDGGKATSWKEASVGTLTCYDAEGERLRTLYLGQMPETRKSTLKEQLADELAHVLEFRPDLRVCAVADAAPDNWTFLSQYAPEEFQVVDVWHACQHLGAAAELIFPHDSTARERWFRKYRRILKDETEGVETVIRSLPLLLRQDGPAGRRAPTRAELLPQPSGSDGLQPTPGPEPANWQRRHRECLPERDRAPDETARPALGNGRWQGNPGVSCTRQVAAIRRRVERNPPPPGHTTRPK